MEILSLQNIFLAFVVLVVAIKLLNRTRKRDKNLPPSPPGLPILGHLHQLREPLHRYLFTLSEKYGPIFSLRLGKRLTVVVSSPEAVEECLVKNDVAFADRPYFWSGKYVGYDFTSILFSNYGEHLRNVRRICKHELLSPKCLNMSTDVRKDQVKILLNKLYQASSHNSFAKVELRPLFAELTFGVTLRMIAGKQHEQDKSKEARFQQIIEELVNLGVSGYIGDFLPSLQWLDGGYKKKVVKLTKETDVFLQALINEHRNRKGISSVPEKETTMLSHLLSLQESQPKYYTDTIIKGILTDMLIAGTDTALVTLEWAVTNLLNNPSTLKKARAELDTQIGTDKLLDETDFPNLPYLHNIISETLRLKPTVPLLVPHSNSKSCTIQNYNIPKGTMLLVNAWAIHTDPKLWDEPTRFMPERFENGGNEGYKMLPFGIGRRSCPGYDLGRRVIALALGLMVQLFEWQRVGDKEISMLEGQGLTLRKAEPLEAMCKTRSNIANKLLF